jgi:hypothetical protein
VCDTKTKLINGRYRPVPGTGTGEGHSDPVDPVGQPRPRGSTGWTPLGTVRLELVAFGLSPLTQSVYLCHKLIHRIGTWATCTHTHTHLALLLCLAEMYHLTHRVLVISSENYASQS